MVPRLLILAALSILSASAQNTYFARDADASLSGAALDVTIQQPTTGSKSVQFEFAQVSVPQAATLTISRDGTAASATASSAVGLNGGEPTSPTQVFVDSNAGSGTTIMTVPIAAGQTVTVDLEGLALDANNSATENLTFQISAVTGSASIFIRWRE